MDSRDETVLEGDFEKKKIKNSDWNLLKLQQRFHTKEGSSNHLISQ